MKTLKRWQTNTTMAVATVMVAVMATDPIAMHAAQLNTDARASIPQAVQQIIVVDYRAMQNSQAAMKLKDKVLPPQLKSLEQTLKNSGLQVDQDTDTLAFAAFQLAGANSSGGNSGGNSDTADAEILGVAQGQFDTQAILAKFAKAKTKPIMIRNNTVYPMGAGGMSVCFLNETTMVFGTREAVKAALDARDGLQPNFLQNSQMMNEMTAIDSEAVWSILDQKGTQTMMKSVLGSASGLEDYDTVKNQMKDANYTMDFSNGVRFDMTVDMGSTMTAATASTILKGVALMKETSGTSQEKQALDNTSINSNGGVLSVSYSSSDSQFADLLQSPLFQQVVK